jgi:hypothetical protein
MLGRPVISRVPASVVMAAAAFFLYRLTLLPDFDLGDTPSFQTMAGSASITPRDGYPLYYAIGRVFVWFGGTRAHAMNLASAVEAAVACGVIVLVATELSGSLLAGLAGALMFAGSYTFWSQAVIAEVYALHVLLVAATMLLLLQWEAHPTDRRLALFFGAYALGFGNHLSMILLAPAFALFLFVAAPGGWRSILSPRIVGMATALGAIGALQYGWNFRALWLSPVPPHGVRDALQLFWFDVTKSDWRDTMVLGIPAVMIGERLRMYVFDVVEQLGWIGVGLAALGAWSLFRMNWRRGVLVGVIYAATVAFALGYNVGDAHVFFIPGTLMLALFASCGIVRVSQIAGAHRLRQGHGVSGPRSWAALIAIALAAARVYRDYPALDRSGDNRPAELLGALTTGLDDRNAIFLTDLNWQVQNGLTYFGDRVRPELAYTRIADVLLYAPALIRDNVAIGRDVVLTDRARGQLAAAYGPLFPTVPDMRAPRLTLDELTRDLVEGTRYVLCVLKPTREFAIDQRDLALAVARLTGGRSSTIAQDGYAVVAGLAGQKPALSISSARPFSERVVLDGVPVEVRMDSWLEFDTIRRMGFGHVVSSRSHGANRNHALIVERGISFATIGASGERERSGYVAGIFAREGRHLIRR